MNDNIIFHVPIIVVVSTPWTPASFSRTFLYFFIIIIMLHDCHIIILYKLPPVALNRYMNIIMSRDGSSWWCRSTTPPFFLNGWRGQGVVVNCVLCLCLRFQKNESGEGEWWVGSGEWGGEWARRTPNFFHPVPTSYCMPTTEREIKATPPQRQPM